MKIKITTIFVFWCFCTVAQNDCTEAIITCTVLNFYNIPVSGSGDVQEVQSCSSSEHNSIWLLLPIKQGGTLGFTLTPESTDLGEDYDFWIYGPNVACGSLGMPIRCSTTNPLNTGVATNNLTGMNDTETDEFEGPGSNGNSFIKWLTVASGEIYYMVIDRPEGISNFNLQWTGTAKFHEVPYFQNFPNLDDLNLSVCDNDLLDGLNVFDLTKHQTTFLGNQTFVNVGYFLNYNDAFLNTNPIANPIAFYNTTNPQTVYIQLTNTVTGCRTIEDVVLTVEDFKIAKATQNVCEQTFNTGKGIFNLSDLDSTVLNGNIGTVTYYLNLTDAETDINPLPTTFVNTIPYNQTLYVKVVNNIGCKTIGTVQLKVYPLADPNTFVVTQPDWYINTVTVTTTQFGHFTYSLNNLTSFTEQIIYNNVPYGWNTLYILDENNCSVIAKPFSVVAIPNYFTPNNDGYNDTWNIIGLDNKTDITGTINIYDRFGKLVKNIYPLTGSWDGTLHNKPLFSSDYWYVITLTDGRVYKGHFSLVR